MNSPFFPLPYCGDDGIRLGGIGSCDHTDYGAIAKRGIRRVLQALKEAKK